jgi:hypothetical protein
VKSCILYAGTFVCDTVNLQNSRSKCETHFMLCVADVVRNFVCYNLAVGPLSVFTGT